MKGARFPIDILATREAACVAVADDAEPHIRAGGVLGLATGGMPLLLYREWVRRHRETGLSFRSVTGIVTDEFEGLGRGHDGSRVGLVNKALFSEVRLGRTLFPSGLYRSADEEVSSFERQIRSARGIDWMVMDIGPGGRLGFNEPGSARDSRARRVELSAASREELAEEFGSLDRVPGHALTMGVGTLLEARRIVLVGWGSESGERVKQALQGPVTEAFPASFLQLHDNVRVILAEAQFVWS
ncbi:glucosamine-6-phosphate deaminase [Luteolibacter marinus]|uniref:glucosamine-6-phosphate deaminase n=1 Tax=Luteolibacter marinus TaxID=2776705 RepID=UPI001867B2AF|nr:glucosamine-6-phosphate deaminase [Luteolibacter marinus]